MNKQYFLVCAYGGFQIQSTSGGSTDFECGGQIFQTVDEAIKSIALYLGRPISIPLAVIG